jgi:tetratricopeptide (TPR) repeat protein
LTQPTADPLVGTIVGQYEILARIGGGGMGLVYAARDTKLGRRVALKFLPPQWSHDEGAKQRFTREAQAASATDHPNICTIHDIDTTPDGRLFIVMAYYEGQTLKQKLEGGPLDIDVSVEIAAQTAEGLAKAHAHGVVHRDVKPGNLMVCDEGVKILDFGLAKFATAQQLTLEGSTLGTAAYMSPEQVRGEEADARSDVWSLGVVLYEMLAGHPPFQGHYAEAVAYAIRNETPTPLRAIRPEVPEALEQIVFRALHKDPAVRYQQARDLVRALRGFQGRTLPEDLLTRAIELRPSTVTTSRHERRWGRHAAIAVAIVVVAAAAAYPILIRTGDRIPVAVVPVINQTGYPELDPYRLPLTQVIVAELSGSPNVRAFPYTRLLEIVRRFRTAGDVSSREAVQAITVNSGAESVVVPTLLYEDGAWRGRVEVQDPATATTVATYQTEPAVSSLAGDTAYALAVAMARDIQEHFQNNGPGASYSPRPASARLRTLDAVAAFEEGLGAVDEFEYAQARRAFERAVEQDPRHLGALAWLTRAMLLLGEPARAADAAERANRLIDEATPLAERLFAAAVVAEARRDVSGAEARYRELADAFADEAGPLLELAGFQDRQGRNTDAIATLQRARALDPGLGRADLDLCRMYNRVHDLARAREHARAALSRYAAIGARGGEAQARFCLTEALRFGDDAAKLEARQQADAALAVIRALQYPYNLPRALNYVALAAEAQGHLQEAVEFWELARAAAAEGGNAVIEPLVVMNLGSTHHLLGHHARAIDYYRQSAARFASLGDEARAAENEVNIGAIMIEAGDDPDEGLRRVQNAMAVFRKIGNRDFEVFAAQTIAAHHRQSGRHAEAERELNRAMALAKERNLDREVAVSLIGLGQSRFETADYGAARDFFVQAASAATAGRDNSHARVRLALSYVRLGDAGAAGRELDAARREAASRGDTGLLPLIDLAGGELAYELGSFPEARRQFAEAATLWTDASPDPASVEATAYLGLVDAIEGNGERGRAQVVKALEQARRMRRLAIEARCLLYLGRIEVQRGRFDEARRWLAAVPADEGGRAIGAELRALVHYWTGRALAGAGDAAADADRLAARQVRDRLAGSLPESFRASFAARRDIRVLSSD